MAISYQDFLSLLEEKFPDDQYEIKDLAGDENHYELTFSSKRFVDMSRVAQHKYVMQGLEGYVGTIIHALSIKTKVL